MFFNYTDEGNLHVVQYDNYRIIYHYYITGNIKYIAYYKINSNKWFYNIMFTTSASLVRKYDITFINKLVFKLNNITLIY